MEPTAVHGESTHRIRIGVTPQVYKIRDWLLTGKALTCKSAREQLNIGSSALPRRVKDCKDILQMRITGRWIKYTTTEGIKTHVREYSMTTEAIHEYREGNKEGLRMYYGTQPGRRPGGQSRTAGMQYSAVDTGASPAATACSNQ